MWLLLLLALAAAQPDFLPSLAPHHDGPQLVPLVLGQTVQGNPLTVHILSNTPVTSLPDLKGRQAVLLNSYMHAREPYSLQMMEQLTTNILQTQRTEVKQFLERGGLFVFYPFVNPDGYRLYSNGHSADVRKNANTGDVKCSSGLAGVDINRNFPAKFGTIPESSNPCSEEYHGKNPFSEAEAQVFQQLFLSLRVVIAIDIHSYGNEWIYPYAWDATGKHVQQHSLYPFYKAIERQFAARGRKVLTCVKSLGYTADGVYIDWALDQGALAFAFEVGTTFHSDPKEDINHDIERAIEDFYLIFKRTRPEYETKTKKKVFEIKSTSLSFINLTVEVGNLTQTKELSAGETFQVPITPNDTYATIINHSNGEKKDIISLKLGGGLSLSPTSIFGIISVLLVGLLLSFYSRWQRLQRKYAHVTSDSTSLQELPSARSGA